MKAFLAGVLCIFVLFPVSSDEKDAAAAKDAKMEKAEKVISLTRISELYIDTLLERLKLAPIDDEDKELYYKFITPESLTEKLIPVYAEMYTEEELDAMIKFYSSAEGAAIAEKSGEIVGRIREKNLDWEIEIAAKVKNEKAKKAVQEEK